MSKLQKVCLLNLSLNPSPKERDLNSQPLPKSLSQGEGLETAGLSLNPFPKERDLNNQLASSLL
jgi:hypothetical protein